MRLGVAGLLGVALCAGAQAEPWYRGCLHMHSLWSDGNVMPEDAVGWYREHGYQFVCLSDHQALQLDTNAWLEVGSKKLSRAQADAYLKGHPASAVVKRSGGKESRRPRCPKQVKEGTSSMKCSRQNSSRALMSSAP